VSNEPISEQFRITAKEWVAANTAADMLEECKSAVLSQQMHALGDMPVSRAEMEIKASADWTEYLRKMVEARGKANLLKVKCEYLRMRFQEQSSAEASKRAEMRL
jgi:hypothetical protein